MLAKLSSRLASVATTRSSSSTGVTQTAGRALSTFSTPSGVWGQPKTVNIFGAPLSFGQPITGPETAPESLRSAGLHEELKEQTHWRINDLGDVDFSKLHTMGVGENVPGARHCLQVGAACEAIYQALLPAAEREEFVLTLGGDHSIPLGTLPAILEKRPKTKVVWVDAHADLNTPLTSGSGNMHGQPLGLLTRGIYPPGVSSLPGFEWLQPCLDPSDIIYIALRDVDKYEKSFIRDLGITAYTMFDIDRLGIGEVMKRVLREVGEDNNIHLSFDIDACDPFYAPSTGTKVGGGLTFREAHFICESLADTRRLTSMDMVEVNTTLNPEMAEDTVLVAKGLVASALGSCILWPVEEGLRTV